MVRLRSKCRYSYLQSSIKQTLLEITNSMTDRLSFVRFGYNQLTHVPDSSSELRSQSLTLPLTSLCIYFTLNYESESVSTLIFILTQVLKMTVYSLCFNSHLLLFYNLFETPSETRMLNPLPHVHICPYAPLLIKYFTVSFHVKPPI